MLVEFSDVCPSGALEAKSNFINHVGTVVQSDQEDVTWISTRVRVATLHG